MTEFFWQIIESFFNEAKKKKPPDVMSKYSIHVVLFTTNTCCGGINMLMRQLQLLAIIVGIVRACPEDCKCFSKTLDCSFRRLKELFNIHDNYQIWNFSGNSLDTKAMINIEPSVTDSVQIFDISHNKLCNVKEPSFLQFSQLRELNLSHNELNDFEISLPQGLEVLYLGNNLIHTWPHLYLAQASQVKKIHFDHNLLNNMSCEADANSLLHRLINLDLSYNHIEHIDKCILKTMPDLTDLNLSNNKLSAIKEGLFDSNTQLQKLDLSKNMLRKIPGGVFENLPNLAYLFLSHNKLVTFPLHLPVFEVLDLSFNEISCVKEDKKKDVYPHEILLLGGNPFHCDCKIRWLKEFIEMREYQLHYFDIPEEKFIPICHSPYNLFNEPWNMLSTDLFVCDYDNIHEEEDTIFENSEHESEDNLKLEAVNIAENSVKLQWKNIQVISLIESTYQLKYHQFGHRNKETIRSFRSTTSSYVLHNLTAGTAYIICLQEVTSISNKELDCVELITAEDSSLLAYLFFACILSVLFFFFRN